MIGAHIGSLEYDVDEVAKRLDTYPNFHVEVSARTRDLTRQPSSKVRAFFLKYRTGSCTASIARGCRTGRQT